MAVSIAAGQVTDHAFVGELREILRNAGLEPGLLEIDVTEDVLLYDSARSARTLTALKSLGVSDRQSTRSAPVRHRSPICSGSRSTR